MLLLFSGHATNFVQNEKWSDTRTRLVERIGSKAKGKNFEKTKFAVVRRSSYSKPTYLTDGNSPISPAITALTRPDDILWEFASQDDDMLGLDHINRDRSRMTGTGDLFLK